MVLRKATRRQSKLRLGISGPSGSGKTYSALLLASGMASWDKIAVIDTENGSGDLYAHLGEYNVLALSAPFSPERYIEAIRQCEEAGMEVVIIDSVSHEWEGKGGILETNELIGQTKFRGNSWAAWSVSTPKHQAFLQAILNSSCHIITTARAKTDTVQEGGKVKKIGVKEIQREGYEYEMTLNFTLDRDSHLATPSKDRTELFEGKDPVVISAKTGKILMEWCNSGAAPVKKEEPITAKPTAVDLPPDANWGKENFQNLFMIAFNDVARAKKWKPDMIKKNFEAILKGRELKDISDNILIQLIEQLKLKAV